LTVSSPATQHNRATIDCSVDRMSNDDIQDAIDDALPPDPLDCPATALGFRGGRYFFISAAGEVVDLGPRDFTAMALLSLCAGSPRWLIANFPKSRPADGEPPNDFSVKDASAALMRYCVRAGVWDPETPIRGLGVWPDGPLAIIAHCGDALYRFDGGRVRKLRAGRRDERAIYPVAPPVTPPAPRQIAAADARGIVETLRLWSYARAESPRLILGFVGTALLGAAAPWRVHMLQTGERGTGKTTFAGYVRELLGPQARMLNDFTEAGLRQQLTGEARALILDEAEGGPLENRMSAVIGLLRRMAGGDGVQAVRGSADGNSRRYTVTGSVMLSAINAPPLLPQDRSRILEIELRKPAAANGDAVARALFDAPHQSAALRARAIRGFERFRANLTLYRAALIDRGCDARQADKFGTLLAAAEMLCGDEVAHSDTVADDVESLSALLTIYRAEDEEDSDQRRCLTALLTKQIEHWRGGSKSTLGRLVAAARTTEGSEARAALRVYGLRVDERDLDRLLVANRHSTLSDIFRATPWSDGRWKSSLLRLDGAAASGPVRFDGVQQRGVVIPAQHLPSGEDGPVPGAGEDGE
jgi:hypothetical protein